MLIKPVSFISLIIMCFTLVLGEKNAAHVAEAREPSQYKFNMFVSHSYEENNDVVVMTGSVMLATGNVPLNAFEAEIILVESDNSQLNHFFVHEGLCEPRFTIKKTVDIISKTAYVACGTTTPFITGNEIVPIITIRATAPVGEKPKIMLGKHTGFYVHDGVGTQAAYDITTEHS